MIDVIIVCFKYPPIYSGYGRQLKLIVDKILSENDKIRFTVLTGFRESQIKNEKIRVIPLLGEYEKKERDTNVYPFAFEVFKWLLKNRKSVSLIHCIKAGPEALSSNLISKIFRIPLLVKVAQDELSSREFKNKNILRRGFIKARQKLIGTANYFIAISDEIAVNIKNIKGKNTEIFRIPNGVETDKFKPVDDSEKKLIRQELRLNVEENIVLYIGAINSRKGIPEFLDALERINLLDPFTVVICGPVLEDINFTNRVNSINSSPSRVTVNYMGTIENPEDYMRASDIFILPSHSEGLPNVLLEAGASGLALIATDIGGSREIVIDNENGILVPVGDDYKIEQAIIKLIKDKNVQTKFKKKSREHITEHFSVDSVNQEYSELYNKIKK